MSVLSAVRRKDAAGRHGLAVNGFDDTHLIGSNFNQGHFADDFLKRKLDEMQARLQHVSLDTDLTFSSDHSSRWHFCTQVSAFFDCDLACADVNEGAIHDDEENDQKNECSEEHGQHSWDVKVLHGMS